MKIKKGVKNDICWCKTTRQREVPLRLKIQRNTGMYFSLRFAWYPIKLDIVH